MGNNKNKKMLAKTLTRGAISPVRGFSMWSGVPNNPPDSILGLLADYRDRVHPKKVNLTAGAYRCNEGKPWIMPSVRMAIDQFNASNYNLEYIPINGHRPFIDLALDLAYGAGHPLIKDGRLASIQTMSGCGAIYVGLQFYREFGTSKQVWYSNPTWPIQQTMAEYLGFDAIPYPYYNAETLGIDFDGMVRSLNTAEEGAMIMLHACSHNPTGFDLTQDQWRTIMDLCVQKKLLPYFDMAYQGFATGNLTTDNWAVRLFADNGVPFMCGTSFAKNMGLYGTRTGTLSVVCDTKSEATNVQSQLNKVGRNTWSSAPLHGCQIAEIVLKTPEIRTIWDQDLLTMSGRIREMREMFVQKLYDAGSPHDWSHILNQIGMFAFTGVGKKQCQRLMDEKAVYLTLNGRISIAGLNTGNMDYTVESFHQITKDGRS